jgi:phospholipid transport system substrate-binding protein
MFQMRYKTLARLIAAAVLAGGLLGTARAETPSGTPSDTIRSFYGTLLGVMKNAQALGERGRYETLRPVVRATFDLPAMTRLAVGPQWATLSPGQQEEATEALGHYVAATYADRFDGFAGEKLEVQEEQPSKYGVLVTSRIVKSDGEPVSINYLMRQVNGGWQIGDVYLTGTISQLATLRSEFSSVLRERGVDGLVAALNKKVDLLVASTAR